MKESTVSENMTKSSSATRKKEAASLAKDGPDASDLYLMNIVQRAGCSNCGLSLQSITSEIMHPSGLQKQAAAMSLQKARGNRFVQRMAIQAKISKNEEMMQGKFPSGLIGSSQANEKAPSNQTGMPDQLKSSLENLSGMDLSGVRVHYSSSKPAQLNALAYTQGQEIHIAPGQERHLPHEGWHAVQQMQGRVRPMMRMMEEGINIDPQLETEADMMSGLALQGKPMDTLKARGENTIVLENSERIADLYCNRSDVMQLTKTDRDIPNNVLSYFGSAKSYHEFKQKRWDLISQAHQRAHESPPSTVGAEYTIDAATGDKLIQLLNEMGYEPHNATSRQKAIDASREASRKRRGKM